MSTVLLAVTLAFSPAIRAEQVLTNEDIVKLVKLDLGDEAVIAKIRQAAEVDFQLDTDDLVELKDAGVDGKIIAAMLDRPTGRRAAETGSSGGFAGVLPGAGMDAPGAGVKLIDSDGKSRSLGSMVGQLSTTYAFVKMLLWLNFPGQHATIQVRGNHPDFLVLADADPRSRYYVVRLDVNDESNDRSLKVGQGGPFAQRVGGIPDSDWTFAYDVTESSSGVWKLTLKQSLEKGEYGVFSVRSQELYDFGVN
jgi:hypothetical protein